jgi:hypothetical protein
MGDLSGSDRRLGSVDRRVLADSEGLETHCWTRDLCFELSATLLAQEGEV